MPRYMGLDSGFANVCKRKNRWMMTISEVSGENVQGTINILPPLQSARPNISFKEMEARHLNEDVFYPAKPDWKPIQLVLYDIKTNARQDIDSNPVFNWIRAIYIPKDDQGFDGHWQPPVSNNFIRRAELVLYDGCGNELERWIYENAWPQSVDFKDLDMGSAEILTCAVTLRYVRAYVSPKPS